MPDIIAEANAHPAFRLKYKGIFDYNNLTTFLINWLKERNFEVTEKVHKHKMSCPHGFEIEREIVGEKKITEYFQHVIEFKMHLWDASEVEAIKNGKKVMLWNARIEVQMGFDIVCDYADKWGKTPFLEKLLKFYNRYIIKREIIIKHADSVYYKLLGLNTKVKKMFEMETATEF